MKYGFGRRSSGVLQEHARRTCRRSRGRRRRAGRARVARVHELAEELVAEEVPLPEGRSWPGSKRGTMTERPVVVCRVETVATLKEVERLVDLLEDVVEPLLERAPGSRRRRRRRRPAAAVFGEHGVGVGGCRVAEPDGVDVEGLLAAVLAAVRRRLGVRRAGPCCGGTRRRGRGCSCSRRRREGGALGAVRRVHPADAGARVARVLAAVRVGERGGAPAGASSPSPGVGSRRSGR